MVAVEIPAPRGTIFDRTGQPLAMSVPTESVSIDPLRAPDLGVASELLALVLHLDRTALYGKMKWAHDNHHGFLWVKRKIGYEEGAESAQSAPGMDSHPRREPAPLPEGDAGGARSGVGGFRRKGQRGNREGPGCGTARPAGAGADADGREAPRHRFPVRVGA